MLYAQKKERDNRFKLALRTVIPSLLFVITIFVLFFNNDQLFLFFVLMAAVSLVITYYNLYVIYNGFDKNIIDPDTLMLNYKTFKHLSKKLLDKNKPSTFLMIKLGDLEDINAHYGREQTNITLKQAINTLLLQIDGVGFKNIPAGSFGGGVFVLFFKEPYVHVVEKVKPLFEGKEHCYINDIEMDVEFALVDAEDEHNCETIFGHLFDLISQSHGGKRSFDDYFNKEKIIEKRVREAISSRSLSLKYQEIMASNDDKPMIEFTAKLIDNQNKLIHHSDINPVIKRLGLEKNFYLLVIEEVLKLIQTKKIDNIFAINITAFAFRHKELIQILFKMISSYEIRPSQMLLVINEDRYYKHLSRYKEIINDYRQQGILVAFSDLGSVNPALEYLKHIDVDFVRYDRSLSEHLDDPQAHMVFEGIDSFICKRGIKRWANMIQNQSQENKLRDMGIDYLQGRHIASLKAIDSLDKI